MLSGRSFFAYRSAFACVSELAPRRTAGTQELPNMLHPSPESVDSLSLIQHRRTIVRFFIFFLSWHLGCSHNVAKFIQNNFLIEIEACSI